MAGEAQHRLITRVRDSEHFRAKQGIAVWIMAGCARHDAAGCTLPVLVKERQPVVNLPRTRPAGGWMQQRFGRHR